MKTYRPMLIFDNNLKAKIIKCWQDNRRIRWRYGTLKPADYGVSICTRGGIVRDKIRSEDIAEYLASSQV